MGLSSKLSLHQKRAVSVDFIFCLLFLIAHDPLHGVGIAAVAVGLLLMVVLCIFCVRRYGCKKSSSKRESSVPAPHTAAAPTVHYHDVGIWPNKGLFGNMLGLKTTICYLFSHFNMLGLPGRQSTFRPESPDSLKCSRSEFLGSPICWHSWAHFSHCQGTSTGRCCIFIYVNSPKPEGPYISSLWC